MRDHGPRSSSLLSASGTSRSASFERGARDPMSLGELAVGALYHLEWDAHDEGAVGMYRYLGRYAPTHAYMFQPIRRARSGAEIPGSTIYLFPHEIRYVEALTPVTRVRSVPPAPESAKRPRLAAPALRAGRVLQRPARSSPYTWDVGIVGPSTARAARFVGFRRIDDALFAVWSEGGRLYAQPWSRD